MTFRYRTASDDALFARHFKLISGEPVLDMAAAAILTGIPEIEVAKLGSPSGLTADDLAKGAARRETVEIKLGRDATFFDVLREFGDEMTAAGLLVNPQT